ncbi:MAG: alpha/beta fold hydrolase [Bauldia sp.]|nr:alpha/beta fold hydrolase [Bauldia sp.]
MDDTIEVETMAARLSVSLARGRGPAVLLLHGNSLAKETILPLTDALAERGATVVAPDLPGHGRSEDAANPEADYTLGGLAGTVLDLADRIGLSEFHVVGWSLGGNVALDLLALAPERVRSVAAIAAPPIRMSAASIEAAFLPSPAGRLVTLPTWSEADARAYLGGVFEPPLVAEFLPDALRADGRCRTVSLFTAFAGAGTDQVDLVARSRRPLALLVGERDPLVSRDYLAALPCARLWRGAVSVIPRAGHAPQWDAPRATRESVLAFLADSDPAFRRL